MCLPDTDVIETASRKSRVMHESSAKDLRKLAFGPCEFNFASGDLLNADGTTIPLRPKSREVLAMLADNVGEILPKDQLIETVWADTFVTDDSLVQCISEIRKAIGTDGHKVLQTLSKRGYRLNVGVAASVQATAANRPPARLILAALVVVFVGIAGFWFWPQPASTAPKTIAVLPFLNMSGSEDQEYFSDGMSEDLITDLSKISDLRVLSRTASFAYKGQELPLVEIASQLRAEYIVDGSVRRVGDKLRISAQLVDGATGENIWAERYDGSNDDIFTFQDDVLQNLVTALSVRLSMHERERLGIKGTESVEAHDLYYQGVKQINFYTKESNLEAERLLKEALRHDSEYAAAVAQLSIIYSYRVENEWSVNRAMDIERALYYAKRAVALDEDLPLAHFMQARLNTRSFVADLPRAIAGYERLVELDPGYIDGAVFLSMAYIFNGQAEKAMPLLEAALTNNLPIPFYYYQAEGMALYYLRRYEEAVEALTKANQQNPTAPFPYRHLIAAYGQLGQIDDAEWMVFEYEAIGRTATKAAMTESSSIQDPGYSALFEEGLEKAGL